MQYTIRGDILPILDVQLNAGESLFSEAGGMAWMSPNINMESSTRGGLMKGLTRMVAGESLFMTTYACTSGTGIVSFCMETPGKIVPVQMQGDSLIVQRDAFMAGTQGVDVKMKFNKKIGAGFFGGEGFILQEVTGNGTAFLEITGEVTEYTLQKGQSLKIDPGYIGAFESSVSYDIARVKGVKNMLFGGEGIFLATLTGPGKIWLQGMPLMNLAAKLSRYIPRGR